MKSIYFLTVIDTLNYINSSNNKGFVLHAPVDKINELSKDIGDNVVLCSTAGEYTKEGYKNGVITGFQYDLNEGNIIEILFPPVKSLELLKSSYEEIRDNKNAFMLLFCDGLSGMEESIISTFYFMDNNFKFIGGSAGDGCPVSKKHLFILDIKE